MLEQTGTIPNDIIASLREAILENNVYRIYEVTGSAQQKIIERRHGSSFCSLIRATYPASVTNEFSVDIDGENYIVIYGRHVNGGFCCIPSHNFGCELGSADDTFYNAKKLFTKFTLRTAHALAGSIKTVCGTVDPSASGNDDSAEPVKKNDPTVLTLPWATAMNLTTRAHNCLARNGHPARGGRELRTVGDVAIMTLDEIYKMKNAGNKTRKEIAGALKTLGVTHSAWYKF